MLYREAGQFKTTYAADQQIFPIRQDRIGIIALLAVAFIGVPLFASEYWFSAILIPFLIFALASLGLNVLTGYAGQLSLGSAAFMAVGAYAAYNFQLRIEGIPILLSFAFAGLTAASVGILFGLPSLRGGERDEVAAAVGIELGVDLLEIGGLAAERGAAIDDLEADGVVVVIDAGHGGRRWAA